MKDSSRPCTYPQSEKHITDLADGRIGQNAFYIGLHQRRKSRHQRGSNTDNRHYQHCGGC